jgi:dsDNA-specific endonuclease/ATPase MutS2
MAQLQNISTHELAEAKPIAAPKPQSKSSKPKNDTLEVDLHINQILETTAGMSNGEMLEGQLDTFRRTMDANANNHGRRIVFIHGVGNGRLKTELRRELDRKYKQHTYQDASFREYGYGATLVIIK